MICPNCLEPMEIEDVLISKTTDPKDDDLFEKMWCCDTCDYKYPVINSEEDDEQ